MSEWWPLLLGWPAVLFGLTMGVSGVFKKKPVMLYLAAVLILPISLYLAATPRFAGLTLLLPLAMVLAGLSIKKGKMNPAFLLILAVAVYFVWLAQALV